MANFRVGFLGISGTWRKPAVSAVWFAWNLFQEASAQVERRDACAVALCHMDNVPSMSFCGPVERKPITWMGVGLNLMEDIEHLITEDRGRVFLSVAVQGRDIGCSGFNVGAWLH